MIVIAAVAIAGCGRSRPTKEVQPAVTSSSRAPSAAQHVEKRRRMVEEQIASPTEVREPIIDEAVLAAMRAVPRHAFVPRSLESSAYDDGPLPIGAGQTISQPYIVALATEQLGLRATSKVLEVGVGSGYQAAVLAEITPHVFGIEIVASLCERARETLRDEGYTSVRIKHGDGYFGWKEESPFDAIIVSCAVEDIPAPLWGQLRTGGRMVIPVGDTNGFQELIVVTKKPGDEKRIERITGVRFVPLTGEGARERAE